jgi:hypothetical protein
MRDTRIIIQGGNPAVLERIAEAAAAGGGTVNLITPKSGPCDACGGETALAQLKWVKNVGGSVCPLCARAAGELRAKFEEQAALHRAQFEGQLRRMVVDRRSGCDEPTFYLTDGGA